ncbi:flagellar hook capping FlgD N-terminal domain-containing protein [Sphingomonas sp. AOB5]|uniref:flagellar hook assembly protein FlgD n=1 Tax=Sphingomonas sp. AOB5 TaxID=3034017 RepID=UPI0023F92222|nr:flagellar hook capping FlgD N-terminal domain-containing protein [Sphingomonas sp. AOB5]MDF7777527.1 flagellar hook capping FlgD N-terminal domain-containing protein [Sphingomonas sp. AOB5]
MTTTSFDSALANLGIKRTGASTANTPTADTSQQMDQNDFLTLMTAQLKNQDPFEPVDNSQMVAQMAQFSSLAGISEMNSTLKAISERLGSTTTTDMMSWVGRTVLTPGNVAYPRTDGSLGGTIDLGADATNVTVTIEGPNGAILKSIELGAQSKGSFDFEWDGTTDTGEAAGAGPFTIRTAARNADGGSVTATPLVWAPVTAVTIGSDGSPLLTLPGIGQVSANSVRKVG